MFKFVIFCMLLRDIENFYLKYIWELNFRYVKSFGGRKISLFVFSSFDMGRKVGLGVELRGSKFWFNVRICILIVKLDWDLVCFLRIMIVL